MVAHLDVRNVLAEIAHEIERPAVDGRRLDDALEDVRAFQSSKLAAAMRETSGRDGAFAARQAQMNEMLLALIGEIASLADGAARDAGRASRFVHDALDSAAADLVAEGAESSNVEASRPPRSGFDAAPGRAEQARRAAESAAARRQPREARSAPTIDGVAAGETFDFIRPELTARRLRLPLIGGLLSRIQSRVHLLCLSYAQQVAVSQEKVNQALAERLVELTARSEEQEETIGALSVKLAIAQRRLAQLEAAPALRTGA